MKLNFYLYIIQAHIVNRGFQADRVGAVCESILSTVVVVGVGVQEVWIAAAVWEGVDEARPGRGAPAEEGAEGQGQRQGEEQVRHTELENHRLRSEITQPTQLTSLDCRRPSLPFFQDANAERGPGEAAPRAARLPRRDEAHKDRDAALRQQLHLGAHRVGLGHRQGRAAPHPAPPGAGQRAQEVHRGRGQGMYVIQ